MKLQDDEPQEQQQQLMDTAALALLLHHPSMRCQSAVCTLLCVSKGMHTAIQHACTGMLPVYLDTAAPAESQSQNAGSTGGGSSSPGRVSMRVARQVESFAAWLAQHAALMQHLGVHMDGQQPAALRAAALLAQSLQRAAAVPAGCWGPQSCSLAGLPGSSLLPCLPSSHLTRLELSCEALPHTPAAEAEAAGQQLEAAAPSSSAAGLPLCHSAACAALAGLTRLRSLLLQHAEADVLLPAVSALTHLTELRVVKMSVASVAALQALPAARLQHLSVSVSPNIHGWQRKQLQPQLSHLTALTELSCTGEGLFAVQAHDVLPPALRALTGAAAAGAG
ncbi:hypothetical protein COO60DRAFT_185007 [Scenedesmus sp. NREL 46B-D3]|nr:hypothetical protein COO60DRAFT_185007 [Scenedesmus sp. NREL 46B-D3]